MSHRFLVALIALVTLALPVAAPAAERTVGVGSFDKLRVQGPFEVRVTTGSPLVTITGDREAIDGVEVQSEGGTLILRKAIERWTQRPHTAAPSTPLIVTLATPTLATASINGAGRLSIAAMKGARVDVAVTGAGAISVDAVTADAVTATIIGGGSITLAGRAQKVRLMTNGAGSIDATGLDAGELVVRLDGPGTTKARTRYTASVVNTGIGQVTVAGRPKCTVKADAGGPVTCGGG